MERRSDVSEHTAIEGNNAQKEEYHETHSCYTILAVMGFTGYLLSAHVVGSVQMQQEHTERCRQATDRMLAEFDAMWRSGNFPQTTSRIGGSNSRWDVMAERR